MKNDWADTLIVVGALILLSTLSLLVGYFGGRADMQRQTRNEAVKVGVAEYTVTAEGVVGFRWKEPSK